MKGKKSSLSSPPLEPDLARIDDAVLALLWLTASTEISGTEFAVTTAWKGHDWDALGRLHEKGLIGNPVGKGKSIVFTDEGRDRAEALFKRMFCGGDGGVVRSTAPAVPVVVAPAAAKVRHHFAPTALLLWESIPETAREPILNNTWCSHCLESRRIEDFTGIPDSRGDLCLRGFCAACGHVVVRLIETSETVPHLAPLPIFSLSQRLAALTAAEFVGLNRLLAVRFDGVLTKSRPHFRLTLREKAGRPAVTEALKKTATFGDLLRLGESMESAESSGT